MAGDAPRQREPSAETVVPSDNPDDLTPLLVRYDAPPVKGVANAAQLREAIASWRSCVDPGRARFRVVELLGRGGQGLVFQVGDRDTGRDIAIKTLREDRGEERHVNRFIHEAQVTAQLAHPGIVPVHDIGVLGDGTLYYSMKRVEGESLEDRIRDSGGDPEQRFNQLQLVLKLCDAMAFAHARGVIHRDLKPANILVGDYGEVLIVDWGLAKVLMRSDVDSVRKRSASGEAGEDAYTTRYGIAVGTPAYMSPEQAEGRSRQVDAASDIYSLGVILYELLCGETPYHQVDDTDALLAAVREGRWLRIDQLPIEMPRPLVAVVHKAMALEPSNRYQSAGELAADLRSYLAGLGVSAYRESLDERILRWLRRHRGPVLSAAVAAAIAAAAWIGTEAWQRSEVEQRVAQLHAGAVSAEAAGDFSRALGQLQRVLELDPEDPVAAGAAQRVALMEQHRIAAIAAAAAEEEQRARAVELVGRARQQTADGGEDGLIQAAALYAQAGNLLPPGDDLRQAITRERDDVRGRLQDLRQEADRLLAASLLDSAGEQVAAGRWSHARADLLRATELVPADARSRELELAIERGIAAERADERRRDADHLLIRAREQETEGEFDAAVGSVQAAIEIDPRPGATEILTRLLAARADAREAAELVARRREADALVSSAAQRSAAAEALVLELSRSQREREELVQQVTGTPSNDEQRRELLRLRQRIAELEGQRAEMLAEAISALHAARQAAPDHPPVLRALADYHRDRVLEAEAEGRIAEAAAAAAQGAFVDREGRHRALFAGLGLVRNEGTEALELVLVGDDHAQPATIQPGGERQFARGRYRVTSADGVRCARRLERGGILHLDLPPLPALPPGLRFVAPGPIYGPDGRRSTAAVAGFALAERELDSAAWLAFLNDASVQRQLDKREVAIATLEPRTRWNAEDGLWQREGGVLGGRGHFVLRLPDGTPIDPAAPVLGLSHQDVSAYLAWRRQRDGIAWRLPRREEWILAAQGGDGRRYPWGDDPDLGRCYSHVRSGERVSLALRPGGSHPGDQSVAGIMDLAGSLSEWTASGWPGAATLRVHCGGSWADHDPMRFVTTGSRGMDERLVSTHTGFRLAVSVIDGGVEPWPGGEGD